MRTYDLNCNSQLHCRSCSPLLSDAPSFPVEYRSLPLSSLSIYLHSIAGLFYFVHEIARSPRGFLSGPGSIVEFTLLSSAYPTKYSRVGCVTGIPFSFRDLFFVETASRSWIVVVQERGPEFVTFLVFVQAQVIACHPPPRVKIFSDRFSSLIRLSFLFVRVLGSVERELRSAPSLSEFFVIYACSFTLDAIPSTSQRSFTETSTGLTALLTFVCLSFLW